MKENDDDYVLVEGHPNLRRNGRTGAIVNIDRTAIQAAKESKRERRRKTQAERFLHERVLKLEEEVSQLRKIVENLMHK